MKTRFKIQFFNIQYAFDAAGFGETEKPWH